MKILKTILFNLILAAGCASVSFAQPAWNVDPHAFEFSMTITAKITTDGDLSENVNDRVAAFVDGTCRGVTGITYENAADGFYLYLMVYGNKPAETVTFKIYDAFNNEISNAKNSLVFVINGIVGSLDSPFIISSEKLNDKAQLSTLTIPGQKGETVFRDKNVCINPGMETVLTGIAANFTVSEGAKVFVNGLRQESGKSINDFSNPVQYTVVSADFSDTAVYMVIVAVDPTISNHVEKEKYELMVYPNPFKESIFVEMPNAKSEALACIYSISGKMVLSQKLTPGVVNKIRTDSLVPGIYIISYKNETDLISKKLVKTI